MELSTDGHLTLQGGILAATFASCLLVEPHRQGYTQDLNFRIEKELRERGLLKAQIIEWHPMGVGHREDGYLDLDTRQIKPPNQATLGPGGRGRETT